MKKNNIPLWGWTVILAIVLIIVIGSLKPREFPLQYLENGEMETEVFKSTKEFNQRATELKADSVKYWLP